MGSLDTVSLGTLFSSLLVLAGMVVMAWNTWKTFQAVKSPAPQPILPVHVSEAKA